MRNSKSNFLSGNENKKTLHKNLEFTAVEQYKLLRTNLLFTLPQDEKCSIIGITSAMRGEGKSTTAVNLSYVLAESGTSIGRQLQAIHAAETVSRMRGLM